jgi:hypothetical protein
MAVLDAFGGDIFEFRGEGVNVADARSAGGHALLAVLLELEEIEVVAAIGGLGGTGHGGGGASEEGDARGQCERLLGAGEQHIEAETVEVDLDAEKELTESTMNMTSGYWLQGSRFPRGGSWCPSRFRYG